MKILESKVFSKNKKQNDDIFKVMPDKWSGDH